MNKKHSTALIIVSGLFAAPGLAFAQSQPAAKATAQVAHIVPISGDTASWQPVLHNNLKTSQQKDLFIGVSLECGLVTETVTQSKGGKTDTSTAEAMVEVQVVIDAGTPRERIAEPGTITFCKRAQKLSATFAGIFQGPAACTSVDPITGETIIDTACLDDACLTVDPVSGVIVVDDACLAPEEVGLLLDTMTANTFNFVLDDLGSGVHSITVYARLNTTSSAQAGSASSNALLGKGSLTVEEVRLIKGEDIIQ